MVSPCVGRRVGGQCDLFSHVIQLCHASASCGAAAVRAAQPCGVFLSYSPAVLPHCAHLPSALAARQLLIGSRSQNKAGLARLFVARLKRHHFFVTQAIGVTHFATRGFQLQARAAACVHMVFEPL